MEEKEMISESSVRVAIGLGFIERISVGKEFKPYANISVDEPLAKALLCFDVKRPITIRVEQDADYHVKNDTIDSFNRAAAETEGRMSE